nr:uncharacterized protein LOC128690293 isoform X2 [Cherax quadricarinatus]
MQTAKMKTILMLVVTVALAHPAPQHRLTGKAYVGLSQALGGRIPVGIYSADRIFHAYENHDNDVVVLNFPGLSEVVGGRGLGTAATKTVVAGGVAKELVNTKADAVHSVDDAIVDGLVDTAFDAVHHIAGTLVDVKSPALIRTKRQDSERSNANQLSFALSGLGTLFVRRN